MQKIFLLLPFILLFFGCEQLENITEFDPSQRYPIKVGHEWEYNTTWKFEFYDQSGNVDSSSSINLGNTIVRIVSDKERLGNYNNLVLFESYEVVVSSPQNSQKIWYLESDTGFFAIAYSNPGASQPVVPKQNYSDLDDYKKLITSINLFPGAITTSHVEGQLIDSVQFYSPPRKVFSFPLRIGARWIELIQPFYRERFINKIEQINTNADNYLCYKIESTLSFTNLRLNDYVNSNSGLIMREIIGDSISVSSFSSPDTVGYYKSTTISKLVRLKK